MSQQIQASAPPLMQQRRGNRLVEFVLIFTICFTLISLLIILEPLARNTVQNHNGQFDLPPRSNHSLSMQSGINLSSSNNRSMVVEEDLKMSLLHDEYNVRNFTDSAVIASQQSDDQDDADNSESDSESCLRPRRNSDVAMKSPLKLPCKIINSFGNIWTVNFVLHLNFATRDTLMYLHAIFSILSLSIH